MTKELAQKIADLKTRTVAVLSIGYSGDEILRSIVFRIIDDAVKCVADDYEMHLELLNKDLVQECEREEKQKYGGKKCKTN